jgi:hypothetical protein
MLTCTARGIYLFRLLVVLIVTALASPAIAGEPDAPRRGSSAPTASPPGGDECLGVPDCVTQRSDVAVIQAGQRLEISVDCGDPRPYAWHWDAWQHVHIRSSLEQRTPTRLTVLVQNVASIDGTVTILVGCSTEPFDEGRAAAQRPVPARTRYRDRLEWPPSGGSVCDAWEIPGEGSPAVPDCIPVTEPPVSFTFLKSHITTFPPCPDSHPFYARQHYTWDDSCFSCVDWTDNSDPTNPATSLRLQCTNWCTARDLHVTAACSKEPFTWPNCTGQVTLTSDPWCPQFNQNTNCRNNGFPVCFLTWNEQCTQGQYAGYTFSCVADQGFLFCDGCKQ